jgi:arylsulfatase A-like enzyme
MTKSRKFSFQVFLLVLILLALASLMHCQDQKEEMASRQPTQMEKPDLFVILLDALRADDIDRSIKGQRVMPYLHRWASQNMTFTVAQSSSSSTPTSISALFSSLPVPAFHGDFYHGIPGDAPVLTEVLSEEGYLSLGYSANPNCSMNLGHGRGFKKFVQAFQDTNLATGEKIRKDHPARIVNPDVFLDRVMEDLEPLPPEPVFVYIHLLQPHAPYIPPPPHRDIFAQQGQPKVKLDLVSLVQKNWRKKLDPDWLEALRAHYDSHCHWVDQVVGEFLQALEFHPRFSRAGIVVLSDHGEGFGEHGKILHNINAYEEMIRIPLIIKPPGKSVSPKEINVPVDLIDIAPTLCGFAGIAPPDLFQGIDLMEAARNPEAWKRRPLLSKAVSREHITMRLGSFKVHRIRNGKKVKVYLFDCYKDPGEMLNMALKKPEICRALITQLDNELIRCSNLTIMKAHPRSLDGEKLEILRSLGYVDTSKNP